VKGDFAQPDGIAISSDGRLVFVANHNTDNVMNMGGISMAMPMPGMAANPGRVIVIDARRRAVVHRIDTAPDGAGPWRGWREALKLAVVVLVATACYRPLPSLTAPSALVFDRQITPFPVLDSAGHAYALPFLGGFEHPRPQLLDIDGDGVIDLFIQENSGELELFQRAPDGWRLATDRFQGIDIGEWYRFVDVDGDGRYDLFAESPLSDIRYYRNVGTRAAAKFIVAADTLKDVQGARSTPTARTSRNSPTSIAMASSTCCSAESTAPSPATRWKGWTRIGRRASG